MSLMVVGTLAFDNVITPFGKRDNVLGGSASFSAVAASYFCEPYMVSIIGKDFPKDYIEFFHSRNINTKGITYSEGKTFKWSGVYEKSNINIAHTLDTKLNVLEKFDPLLSLEYAKSNYVILGNIDPTIQFNIIKQLKNPKLIIADTMNFWIENKKPELKKTLEHVDILSINDGEARQLSGLYNLVEVAYSILEMGPKIIIIKCGEYGAKVFAKDFVFVAPAFPVFPLKDPTGAGDSFIGGMMGYLAKHNYSLNNQSAIRQAVIQGSILASYVIEDFSLDKFRQLEKDDIDKRFKEFKKITHFDD